MPTPRRQHRAPAPVAPRAIGGPWVLLALALCAGDALAQPWGVAGSRVPRSGQFLTVSSGDELPAWSFRLPVQPSTLLGSQDPQQRAYLEDLARSATMHASRIVATYRVRDVAAVRDALGVLADAAILREDWPTALAWLERARVRPGFSREQLVTREALRLLVAQRVESGNAHDPDAKALEDALAQELETTITKGRAEQILSDMQLFRALGERTLIELVRTSVDWRLHPDAPTLGFAQAAQLLAAERTRRVLLPVRETIASACRRALLATKRELLTSGCWDGRLIELDPSSDARPVVVAVWDSGVDMPAIGAAAWTNPGEIPANNIDDDQNGYVDDVHGIAATRDGRFIGKLPMPIEPWRREQFARLDDSAVLPERSVQSMLGVFSHGTAVASVSTAGNPFARVLGLSMNFFEPPTGGEPPPAPGEAASPAVPPGEEPRRVNPHDKIARAYVAYAKAHGARIVQMSWGTWDADAREAVEAVVRDTPELLFIVAAGNDSSDNVQRGAMLSTLEVPNVLLVGALDRSCKPAQFTTWGERVQLFAWGVDVPSTGPGGMPMPFTGTSAAAPVATNLAAKLLALDPSLSPAQLIDLIMRGGTEMPGYPGNRIIHPAQSVALLRERLRGNEARP